MPSQYNITTADISPQHVPSDEYAALLKRPSTGGADVVLDDVLTVAEAEFNSHTGGMFTAAANIALAKPQAIAVAVFRLHARKANMPGYTVPDAVVSSWKAAVQWAQTVGQRLLAAEGSVSPAGSGNVEYSAPTPTHTMAQLGML